MNCYVALVEVYFPDCIRMWRRQKQIHVRFVTFDQDGKICIYQKIKQFWWWHYLVIKCFSLSSQFFSVNFKLFQATIPQWHKMYGTPIWSSLSRKGEVDNMLVTTDLSSFLPLEREGTQWRETPLRGNFQLVERPSALAIPQLLPCDIFQQ